MYVVFSSKWDATRASGQERLFVDAWLELVSDDVSPAHWLPLYSTLQLLANLEVALRVFAPAEVADTDRIRFVASRAEIFPIPEDSPLANVSTGRFAVVDVPGCLDYLSAVETARNLVSRYFGSTRLRHIEFDRSISSFAAVKDSATTRTYSLEGLRRLSQRSLHNDGRFYRLAPSGRNERTFAEIDRVLFWLEQSWRSEEMGSIIAQWTALEFLFSTPAKNAPNAIVDLLPAYIVPQLPRLQLLDFWKFLRHLNVDLPPDAQTRLVPNAAAGGQGSDICNLVALFELCLEDENTSCLLPLCREHPIVEYKWRRIRRLDPRRTSTSSSQPPLFQDLKEFEQQLVFDIRSCYRVRNTIVHDAPSDLAQVDRVSHRLNWFLCTALDVLLHQFTRNPVLSLEDLHNINSANFVKWKTDMRDAANPLPLADVVFPKRHFLV